MLKHDEWIRVEPKRGYVDAYVNAAAIVRIEITMYSERARLTLINGAREFANPDLVKHLVNPTGLSE